MKHFHTSFFAACFCMVFAAQASNTPPASFTHTQQPSPAKPHQPFTWTITLHTQAPFKIKKETPFSLVLNDTPHITYDKKTYKAADLVFSKDNKPSITVKATAHQAGSHKAQGTVSYFLCSQTVCERQQTVVEHTLHTTNP